MLTINPSAVRAAFGDAPVNAPGTTTPSASTDPAGFASLLRQTRVAPVPPPAPAAPAEAKATNEPAPPNESADETPAPQESDTAARARALKGKPRTTELPAPPREARPAPGAGDTQAATPADKTVGDDGKAPETQLKTGEAAIDPNVMQWLAGLQRAAAGSAAAAKVDPDAKTLPAETDTAATESRNAARGSLAADLKADADLKDRAAQGTAQLTDAASASPFTAALTEQAGNLEKPRVKSLDGVKDVAATGASAVAPAPTGSNSAAAPAAVTVAAPVTAPDFAQELGLHLSTLAKDGVQTAELHLNPADMGPVSVQIVMDGTQARVDFGADMAATRQAIEAGLPTLAGALADAGFTLAGGGVSQHAGGRSGSEPGGGDARRARGIVVDDDDVKRVATAARRIVTKGGVDLFA